MKIITDDNGNNCDHETTPMIHGVIMKVNDADENSCYHKLFFMILVLMIVTLVKIINMTYIVIY